MHRVFIYLIFLCVLCASVVKTNDSFALTYEEYPVVKLRSLDKITSRTMTFEAKVGSTVRFGDIFIKVQSCRKPPPVEKSEAAAFLQIWQSKDNPQPAQDVSKWIFSGWMFSSSPALSAMDHPVYDVWVLDCLGRDPEPLPQENKSPVPAPATDGAAPNAQPPAVEPDSAAAKAAAAKTNAAPVGSSQPIPAALGNVSASPDTTEGTVTPADDPGAFEDETPPNTNGAKTDQGVPMQPNAYAPAQDSPSQYKDDETPGDDSAPVDDTSPHAPASRPAENLEPKPDPASQPAKQQFEGIY